MNKKGKNLFRKLGKDRSTLVPELSFYIELGYSLYLKGLKVRGGTDKKQKLWTTKKF